MHDKKLYRKYLLSDEWKEISNKCKELHSNKCNRCGSIENLETHHKTYDSIFNEKQEHLECLCRTCHNKEHNYYPLQTKNIRGGYFRMYKQYDEALEQIVKSNLDFKVIKHIRCCFTKNNSTVNLSPTDIAKHFKTSRQKVTKIIADMVEQDILMKIGRGTYLLNPFMYLPYGCDAESLQLDWKLRKDSK